MNARGDRVRERREGDGLVSTAQMSTSSARPLGVHLVADRVLHERVRGEDEVRREDGADRVAQMVARWSRCGSWSHPKIHSPMNVASRKNASRPSIASGAPKTSPTKREYSDQFMPNWNSCTMPVTTPIAKLMRKTLAPERVMRRYSALPVRYQAVCKIADEERSPIVIGTKRKW